MCIAQFEKGGDTWGHPGAQGADNAAELSQGVAVGQLPGGGWAVAQVASVAKTDVALGAALAFYGTQVEVAVADRTLDIFLGSWLHPDFPLHPASLETPWTEHLHSNRSSSERGRRLKVKPSISFPFIK